MSKYALVKESTGQVVSIGFVPSWMSDPPVGYRGVEIKSFDLPEAATIHDPVDQDGKLSIGEGGIVTVENGGLRRMTNEEINAALLPKIKRLRFDAIDNRTQKLLEQGFEYPGGSDTYFSLSEKALLESFIMYAARNEVAFEYPYVVNSLDDTAQYSISDSAALRAFFLTGASALRNVVDSGTALKEQVRQATTAGAVLAVDDDRLY